MLFALCLRLWLLLLIYRVPFRSGGHRGETPEGRRTWMYAVRGRGRMPLPRIPVMDADPERAARRARRQGVLSFGYFSLHKQRKVTRPQGRKPLLLTDVSDEVSCSSGFSRDAPASLCPWDDGPLHRGSRRSRRRD
ncbi:hypothetical protein CEK68_14195 [Xanthomonas sp. LMG 12461]|nr:hypothetical protein CEK68_14195 [Xanthomonas sp. LMG 12461]